MTTHAKICCILSLVIVSFSKPPSSVVADPPPATANTPVSATIPTSGVTNDTSPPSVPILVHPADGTINSDPTPEFVWRQSADPNSNYVSYTLYLNEQATYLGISNDGNTAASGYISRIENGEVRLTPTNNLADGVYDWYVVASDAAGNSAASTRWRLTLDTLAPNITIIEMDIYSYPTITDGAIFDIAGPKDVYFYLESEPYAAIQITFLDDDNVVVATITGQTDGQGKLSLTQRLELGIYQTQVAATDRANLTSTLPAFYLNLAESTIFIPLPGTDASPGPGSSAGPQASPGITIVVPPFISDLPTTIKQLPVRISRVSTPASLLPVLAVLIAAAILTLLWLLLRKRYNLVIQRSSGQPVKSAMIYHLPEGESKQKDETTYYLSQEDCGRLYIPYLGRHSSLTVKAADKEIKLTLIYTQARYMLTLDVA